MIDKLDLKTDVEYKDKTYTVSTVDLARNFNAGIGKPLYYETMIFIHYDFSKNNIFSYFQERYTTQEEAVEGHFFIVSLFENDKVMQFMIENDFI